MINEETIEKAQDEIEKGFKDYVNQYMIEIMKSIIDDKVSDTRIVHKEHDNIVASLAYEDICNYMRRYATGEAANKSKFVMKPIELDEIERVAKKAISVLIGE